MNMLRVWGGGIYELDEFWIMSGLVFILLLQEANMNMLRVWGGGIYELG